VDLVMLWLDRVRALSFQSNAPQEDGGRDE